MNKSISPDVKEVMNAVAYLPSVSIIMPFEPKMNLKTELSHKLKITADAIEHKLLSDYDQDKAMVVINRLRKLLSELNYDTYKKSIALFVSPLFEKVFYLDIPVEEKVIIDESFEIRDLVYSKKEIHQYLVLILSAEWTKLFLGNAHRLERVKTTTPDNVNALWNEIPERVANFSDPSYRKEVMLNKFLKYSDDGLTLLLKDKALPVFVMGTDRTIGHFKKLTQNSRHIIEYIPGSFDEATEAEIKTALVPYINNWKKVKQEALIQQVYAAQNAGKLVTGVENIWREAVQKNSKLLVVEKNFIYPARHVSESTIDPYNAKEDKGTFIKDAVDDIIEKVLLNGGDVEFVNEGLLDEYGHIALILYY